MPRVADVVAFLERFAPLALAEEWDNVGLIVGDADREVTAVMTCLTLTSDVADEAVENGVQLIVSHHPLLLRPVQRITADTAEGRVLLHVIEASAAVFSPHTSYDSAAGGINQQLAELLGLEGIGVLRPKELAAEDDREIRQRVGSGRFGKLRRPLTLETFIHFVKQKFRVSQLQYVGDPTAAIERVAIACGSAAEFIDDACAHDCNVLLTGEARFHAFLEARAMGIALVLPGHYETERPAVERLANMLSDEFPDLRVWASEREATPVKWA